MKATSVLLLQRKLYTVSLCTQLICYSIIMLCEFHVKAISVDVANMCDICQMNFLLHADKDTLGFTLKLQTRLNVTHTEYQISFMGRSASHIFQRGLVKVLHTKI